MSFSNFFSTRSWNGIMPAVATFTSCAAVFDVLAWLAWHNDQHRAFDLMASMIGFPAVLACLLLAAAMAWSVAGRIPLTQALGWGIRLLPLAWVVPLIDFVRLTGSGTLSIVPYLNGWGILESIGTAGLFPLDSGLPIGIRFGLVAGAFGVAMVSWHLSKHAVKSVLSALWFSFIAMCSTASVSLAIFWNAPWSRNSWIAPAVDLGRKASAVLGKGYWWSSMYDRFPTGIDNQIDIATRLFSAVGALTVLMMLVALMACTYRPVRRLFKYVYGSWTSVFYVSAVLVGLAVAYKDAGIGSGSAFLPAYVFFLFIVASLRMTSVFRRDLSNLERDEREGRHQPILDGVISMDDVKAVALMGEAGSAAAAMALGWPVLLMILAYLGCSKLSRDRAWGSVNQVSTIFRAIGSASLAGFAYLFMTQDVKLTAQVLMAMGIAAAIRFLVEWFWIPRFKGIGERGAGIGDRT